MPIDRGEEFIWNDGEIDMMIVADDNNDKYPIIKQMEDK